MATRIQSWIACIFPGPLLPLTSLVDRDLNFRAVGNGEFIRGFGGDDEMFWKWIVVMAPQLWDYIKNQWNMYAFKKMTFMVCELRLNKRMKYDEYIIRWMDGWMDRLRVGWMDNWWIDWGLDGELMGGGLIDGGRHRHVKNCEGSKQIHFILAAVEVGWGAFHGEKQENIMD